MIEFLTLFLGIVAGPQDVALMVEETVASVELRLDGELLAVAQEAPWKLEVDLGTRLLPRELEAVALDGEGQVVATARQFLNIPRPTAEVSLALSQGANGHHQANIAWESTSGVRPAEMIALLDDNEVPILDGDRVDLRGVDTMQLHVLQVELWFPDMTSARGHLVFGGEYVDETNAELTAFPVSLGRGSPKPAEMSSWFVADAQPVQAVAVEKGLANLVIVRSPGVAHWIGSLEGRPESTPTGMSGAIGPIPFRAEASTADRQRMALQFQGDYRVRIVVPRALRETGQRVDFDLFSVSPELRSRHGGIYWALSQEVLVGGAASRTRVSDAVTLAGLQAAGSNHRRTVLLVLGEAWEDHSRFDVATVRAYLEALNVPVVVWRLGDDSTVGSEWGEAAQISDYGDLKRAWRSLEKSLQRQRVIWLEGLHLPNAVKIAQSAGVEPVVGRP